MSSHTTRRMEIRRLAIYGSAAATLLLGFAAAALVFVAVLVGEVGLHWLDFALDCHAAQLPIPRDPNPPTAQQRGQCRHGADETPKAR